MQLKVVGSSSKGNCYILENDKEALILECGVPFMETKKAIDFNLNKVSGCLVTHEHKDHCRAVEDVLKASIPVFASEGTIKAMDISGYNKPNIVKAGVLYKVGNFKVLPFNVMHDCAEPLGYMIQHEETGNVLFATDTYYLPNRFQNLSNVIIECNYRLDILERNIEQGKIPVALKNRTLESHMSFDTCREALLANDLSAVNNIVLIHLSDGNSNANEFREDIHKATGKRVHIADKGLILKFNKTPF
jgi:phosphoribosyl 1,2-cyclic phosphodiesterase